MHLTITGQHLELTDAIKNHIEEKFERVKKHANDATNAHVTCAVQKDQHSVECTLHIPGHEIFAHMTSDDLYKAIDLMISKLIKQIDKHHQKDRRH